MAGRAGGATVAGSTGGPTGNGAGARDTPLGATTAACAGSRGAAAGEGLVLIAEAGRAGGHVAGTEVASGAPLQQ